MTTKTEVQVTDIGPCRKQVVVKIPFELVQKEFENTVKTAGKHTSIQGFRPGKVPRKIILQKFGDAIKREVKLALIQDTYRDAVTEHSLLPLGEPEIDVDAIPFSEEKPLAYEIEIDVKPKIDLKNYKGLTTKRNSIHVTEKDVDEQIEAVKKTRRRPEADAEEKISEDNFGICSLEFFHDKTSVLKRDAIRLSVITPVVGCDAEKFKKAVLGKKAGAQAMVDIVFPDNFEVEAVRGKAGTAVIEFTKVYKMILPNTEDLLKEFDFSTEKDLREEVKKNIQQHREAEENHRIEHELLKQIIQNNEFELPERIVKDQTETALARFRALRQNAGMQEAALDAEVAAKRVDFHKNAVDQVKGFFLLEAIAKKEKIFVTEEEMHAEFKAIAERNGTAPQEVRNYYENQRLLPTLRLDLMEKKVREFLRESAVIQ